MSFLCIEHRHLRLKLCFRCQGFSELFVSTELPNNELTSIHTPDLPHLLL